MLPNLFKDYEEYNLNINDMPAFTKRSAIVAIGFIVILITSLLSAVSLLTG